MRSKLLSHVLLSPLSNRDKIQGRVTCLSVSLDNSHSHDKYCICEARDVSNGELKTTLSDVTNFLLLHTL